MICPQCGTAIPDGASFCSACGSSVSTQVPQPPTPMQSQASQPPMPQGNVSPQSAQPVAPTPQGNAAPVQPQGYPAPTRAPQPSMPMQQPPASAPQGHSASTQAPQPPVPQGYAAPQYAQPAAPASKANAASTKKPMSPLKYGLIAGAAVLALIVAIVLISGGEDQSGSGGTDTDGTPTSTQPTSTGTSDSTDDSGSTDAGTSTDPIYAEFEGVSFTVPAGWEENALGDGLSYSLWGDGFYADFLVFSLIEPAGGFDADTYLQEYMVKSYENMPNTEVKTAEITSIDGYPAAYTEVVYHFDDTDSTYEMKIVTSTPSGVLVEMTGSCPDQSQEGKEQLHAIAESLAIS